MDRELLLMDSYLKSTTHSITKEVIVSMSKITRIQNIASLVSKKTGHDEDVIKNILHSSIDVIISELKNNKIVHLDKFFSFSRKKVKRNRFAERPKEGQTPKYKISYYSTVRAKPLKITNEELIVEIDESEYNDKK